MCRYFTSDLHFNHPKVVKLRGYDSIKKHNSDIIDSINKTIYKDKNPHLYILGDLTLNISDEALKELSTKLIPRINIPRENLHFILGNHDPKLSQLNKIKYYYQMFGEVSTSGVVSIDGMNYLLSHYPYRNELNNLSKIDCSSNSYNEKYKGKALVNDTNGFLLYGHTHCKNINFDQFSLNIGIDAWGKPVSENKISELRKVIK